MGCEQSTNRVLVVHPDRAVAARLERALAAEGYEVACAPSVPLGRSTEGAFSPDLVIAAADSPPQILRFADLALDDGTHELTRGGEPIALTPTEYRLLHCLLSDPGRVFTRRQLLEHVWSYDFGGDGRVLETYVSYLRRKLDAHGERLIHTVRGVGYVMREPRGRRIP